jgi:signal transduction histidine kinase
LNSLSVLDLVQIHVVHSLAFSICLLVFIRTEMAKHVFAWVCSNLLGSAGFVMLYGRGDEISFQTFAIPNSLILAGGICRAVALALPINRRTAFSMPGILLIVSVPIFMLIFLPFMSQFWLFLLLTSSILVTLSATLFVIKNRLWAGSVGKAVLTTILILSAFGFVWRMSKAYPFGPYTTFIGNSDQQYLALVLLLVVSFFLQVAFFLMVAERINRSAQFAERKAVRSQEQASQSARRQILAENMAMERLKMLNILTHEVRQPLNNAQAALQSIMTELEPATVQRNKLRFAARRAQSVLDEVTLALSNSIVGAMIVQRKQEPNPYECDALPIAELAKTDCPMAQSRRIGISAEDTNVFLPVDPILLRLALRNLLHNAVKFSPTGSPVELAIRFDTDRLGVSFQITNSLAQPHRVNVEHVGDGHLGLFVVKQIARVHSGNLNVIQANPDQVTFELFLPK